MIDQVSQLLLGSEQEFGLATWNIFFLLRLVTSLFRALCLCLEATLQGLGETA